jgi:hypothetical protein
MSFGRQTIVSVVQLLGALNIGAARMLLYKHLGVREYQYEPNTSGFLQALETAQNDSVNSLVGEIVREKDAVRADAPTKHVFEGRWREVERWLLHDGWAIENGQLVRLMPEAEEATGVRDRLIEELRSSDLDNDGAIRKCIEESAKSFMAEPPDYNEATTKVRIALETIARRAATKVADTKGGVAYPEDSWGKALAFLKKEGVLELEEEQTMVRVYTFISQGAHVPVGITGEEWARLARTFGLSSSYFILKKYEAARHTPLSQ